MKRRLLFILIALCYFEQTQAQYHPYKHYARHPANENIYENATMAEQDDESDMCHLTVRCPAIPNLCM